MTAFQQGNLVCMYVFLYDVVQEKEEINIFEGRETQNNLYNVDEIMIEMFDDYELGLL